MKRFQLKRAALLSVLAGSALGLSMMPASAHYTTTRCDSDGDRCYTVRCDDDGDDCVRVGYRPYGYGNYHHSYYGYRPYYHQHYYNGDYYRDNYRYYHHNDDDDDY